MWEIGAALDHPDKMPNGSKFFSEFDLNLQIVAIDDGLFQRTWKPAMRRPVKGADRSSLLLDKDATLVSWDELLVRHAAAFGVRAQTPDDYLKTHPQDASAQGGVGIRDPNPAGAIGAADGKSMNPLPGAPIFSPRDSNAYLSFAW